MFSEERDLDVTRSWSGKITRSRVTVSLSLVSEGLDGKLRSVGKILSWGRTRDGGGGTMSWSLRDSGPHPPQAKGGSGTEGDGRCLVCGVARAEASRVLPVFFCCGLLSKRGILFFQSGILSWLWSRRWRFQAVQAWGPTGGHVILKMAKHRLFCYGLVYPSRCREFGFLFWSSTGLPHCT